MGGGASRAKTLDELSLSSDSEGEGSSEEESADPEEDNLLEQRRAARKSQPKGSQPTVVDAKQRKGKKLPRNVVTAEMRWKIPERYKYPQPEGQVEVIKDPVDGKLRPRTHYKLGGPSQFHAFWRGRLGPLNDMLNLDGSLKKQMRPAHGGIKGAPKDKWADGGRKFKEKEALKKMSEKERSVIRRQKRALKERKRRAIEASIARGEYKKPPKGFRGAAQFDDSDSDMGAESSGGEEDDAQGGSKTKISAKTKSDASRFKSPSRVLAAVSFKSKSTSKLKSKSHKSQSKMSGD